MLEITEIQDILSHFGISVQEINETIDTSHGDKDKRLNYIFDKKYVLKINSSVSMWEDRLQEIHRLITRYRSIGVYCPDLIPTLSGKLSHTVFKNNREYTCFVEEYALYPIIGWGVEHDRKEVIEHLGILASKYSGIDLSETKSMWSIIDLAPLDVDIDEKQENTNTLADSLRNHGYESLAGRILEYNTMLRKKIKEVFEELPRCVYQGDLNSTNELFNEGRFVGLIDFNMAGTDVNVNVFVNETNWFPENEDFDKLTVEEILVKQDTEQEESLKVILKHYKLNDIEKYAIRYYARITNLFQYPNVCLMVDWLDDETKRSKCAKLIEAMVDKPI